MVNRFPTENCSFISSKASIIGALKKKEKPWKKFPSINPDYESALLDISSLRVNIRDRNLLRLLTNKQLDWRQKLIPISSVKQARLIFKRLASFRSANCHKLFRGLLLKHFWTKPKTFPLFLFWVCIARDLFPSNGLDFKHAKVHIEIIVNQRMMRFFNFNTRATF